VVDINASALFEPGEAALQRTAMRTLSVVAKVLEQGTEAIEVEGIPMIFPSSRPQFPQTGSCPPRVPAVWCDCLSNRGSRGTPERGWPGIRTAPSQQ